MPRNLDDFELERTPYTPTDDEDRRDGPAPAPEEPDPATARAADDEEPVRPVADAEAERTRLLREDLTLETADEADERGARPGRRAFPMILAGLALLAFAALAVLYYVFRPPAASPSVASRPAVVPAPPASATAPPARSADLPSLEQSDEFVRQAAAAISTHAEVARWLAQGSLVRTLAAVVTNVVDGETPRPHLSFLAPAQRFRAKGGPGGRIVPDPAGFAGYDRFADGVASIDGATAVEAYRQLEPLFDAAYRELGHPEGGFRGAVDRGISLLLSVPVLDADVALVPHAIGFRYADARLEALSPAQKQFLRIGPRNVRKVQAKLRDLRALLRTEERELSSTRAR